MNNPITRALLRAGCAAALYLAFASSVAAATPAPPEAPLFDDIGDHHAPITTTAALAQTYFNQGLTLSYGFNHAEAVRSFRAAQQADPQCAMCYWGEAYALGPNINKPMDPADQPAAWAAAAKAQSLAARVTPREQAYIAAMQLRYSPTAVTERRPLDQAYADAMGKFVQQFPADLDGGAIYAEALMNLMPWAYYNPDGSAKALTDTVVALLESILARNADHIGAIHFYIHIVEASDTPERAEAGADRLAGLAPGVGHLVHMPAHIYLRVGRYHDATVANERAALADESYINQCRAQGFYPALYYPHNIHFGWYTASIEGRSAVAIAAARKLADNVPIDLIAGIPLIEQFLAVPMFGLIRFARWDEVLAEAQPRAGHFFATAMWHAARGIAEAAKGLPEAALASRSAYQNSAAHYGPDAYERFGFPADTLLAIAGHVLNAAIAADAGDHATHISELESAVRIEDALPYMEPPYWFFPNRHLLGAALLKLERGADAEAVFRADLERHPRNGWALHGLAASLAQQGKAAESQSVFAEFEKTWQHADISLGNDGLSYF